MKVYKKITEIHVKKQIALSANEIPAKWASFLSKRELDILHKNFIKKINMSIIGRELGLSRERIRQIIKKITVKIYEHPR